MNKSPTTLKDFDRQGFQLHGLLLAFSIDLGGETIFIQVEVVTASLCYNLLLGMNWFYSMMAVASPVFCTL